jgi:hypothetical protein
LDLNYGDYSLGQGKSEGRPDQRPRVGHQHYVLSAASRDAQPVTSRVLVLIEQQAAVVDRDPVTSKLIAVDPLRMNTALFGLQFVH